jgi:hypothetical protein
MHIRCLLFCNMRRAPSREHESFLSSFRNRSRKSTSGEDREDRIVIFVAFLACITCFLSFLFRAYVICLPIHERF